MVLRFHQRDLPIPNWLVADRHGDVIIWFALRWAASAFLWCCSYWVLVLLFWRAWLHWPSLHDWLHFHVSSWKGLWLTVAFFGWSFALCRCMVGCFSMSRFCMVELLPPVLGCCWCVLAGSWLVVFISARMVFYVSAWMGMLCMHGWWLSLHGWQNFNCPWISSMALLLCSSACLLLASACGLLLLRVLWLIHPRQLLLVLLCVRLGTLYALVPLLTIVGFFTIIIFQ